jgi:hypothetical protein
MTTPLPPTEPPAPDDKLPGEAGLAALYRQLPQSEPGPALDAAVLHAAAQALTVDENPLAVERRRSPRERGDWVRPKDLPLRDLDSIGVEPRPRRRALPAWLLTLGSAASLVLVAGLAWHMRELPPAASAPTAMDRAAPAQVTTAATLQRATAPAAAMPAAEPLPPPAEPAKQPQPKMMASSLPAPTANALRKAAADEGAERASGKARATGGLGTHAPAPAAAAPAPSVMPQETSGDSVQAAPEMPVTMVAAPAVAPPTDEARAANASYTPAQELDKIRQLFAQGHDDEAQQRLSAFRRAHPQWELPPELRAKLRKP